MEPFRSECAKVFFNRCWCAAVPRIFAKLFRELFVALRGVVTSLGLALLEVIHVPFIQNMLSCRNYFVCGTASILGGTSMPP